MDYKECLALELNNQFCQEILINEGNIKSKYLNKSIKLGRSFQYSVKEFSHRFISWSIFNNVIKIIEYSTEYELLGNQISIEFDKSQILNLNIFENGQTVDFLISTSLSVVRFSVHHPSKLRRPNKESHQYSIFYGNTDLNEIKHYISSYFDITEVTVTNSMIDYESNNAYFNYAISNGTVFTVIITGSTSAENIIHFEMREMSLLSKIFSGFMPRQRSFDYTDTSILDMTYVRIAKVIYLVTISKDNKLRIWNLKDRSCTVSEDLLPCVLESNNSTRSMSTINHSTIISSHKIKSFYANTNINDYIDTVVIYFHCIFGKNSLNNWLVLRILNPSERGNNQVTQLCSNITGAGDNLNIVDFALGFESKFNKVLGVWSLTSHFNEDKHNIYSLNWIPLIEDRTSHKVNYSLYNVSNELDLITLDFQDTQESVLTKIFSPQCFSRLAIINIINKYNENGSYINSDASIDEIKYKLVIAVESKVEKNLSLYLTDDCEIDLIDFNRQQWINVFQEIVEEHHAVIEPLSIILISEIVGLNRFGTVSLMRRVNKIEQALSGSSSEYLKEFYDENILSSGDVLLKYICDTSSMLQLSNGWPMIEHRLLHICHSPIDICHQLSSNFDSSSLNYHFDNQPNLFDQTVNLLEKLGLYSLQENMSSDLQSCKLSSLSIGMLHYSISEVIRQRIFSSLALLTMLIQRSMNSSQGSHLSKLVDRIVCLIKSLVSVYWLLSIRQRTSLELTDVQKSQLSSLNLLENRYESNDGTDILCIKVLQLMQHKFKMNNYQSHSWQTKMNEEMTMIVNHLCPNGDSFPLLEICKYFLSYNLPMELIDYLKILMKSEPLGWWSGDECLVNAVIGLSYLLMNKPWKFVEHILESINAAELSSSLLSEIILTEDVRSEMDSIFLLQACLLMKFIEVIENVDNSQAYVITLADSGIKIINGFSDKNENVRKYKSILMTVLFKNLLEIKKYDEAMAAIMNNLDVDKQKDCLRQFIMVLCDHGKLDKLVGFNYANLNEEFINIITCRARANDLTNSTDSFYNVLYSFHIRNGDMKSAATSMLELALRLDNDMKNCGPYLENCVAIKMLQNQIKAYLTCITTASLLTKDEQLFVFPTKLTEDFDETRPIDICSQIQGKSPMNNSNQTMDLCEETLTEEGTERNIINLMQIRRQYSLIKSRLKLLRESPEHGFVQSGKLSPTLTLTSLLQLGLYSDAILICVNFKLDMSLIINIIAMRCAQVSKNCLDRPILKEKENVIDSLEEIDNKRQVDYASFGSLQKLLWKLLDEVLQRYDSSPHGYLYIRACSKLLSCGIEQLPSWLVNNIVNKNSSPSLIKLYITNNLLDHAVNLACKILNERIDEIHLLKDNIVYGDLTELNRIQTKWMSYPIILYLLEILFEMKKDHEVNELFNKLNDKFKTLISVLQVDNSRMAIESM